MAVDPGVITLIQSTFLERLEGAFGTISVYAFNLLYIFTALELLCSGLAWAFQRDIRIEQLLIKIVKIGVIFFVIRNFPWLLGTIVDSFAKLAGSVVHDAEVAQYIFNPAKLWQYGYDVGINLLHLAANSDLLGLIMLQSLLGLGILLVFGLLGIQIVVQLVGFYLISFSALIVLPIGTLTAGKKMVDRAFQAVLQAGLRLMTIIIVIGIAVTVWSEFDLNEMIGGGNFNLNQPLGLFFTALLFLNLALHLPKLIIQVIGEFSTAAEPTLSTSVVASGVSHGGTGGMVVGGDLANMQAATVIAAGGGSDLQGGGGVTAGATSIASGVPHLGASVNLESSNDRGGELAQASKLSRSISEATVKQIKDDLLRVIGEKQEERSPEHN